MNYFRLKMNLQGLFALAFFIGLSGLAYAQQVTVSGKIFDKKDNSPVAGATVQVKNVPSAATTTDQNGNFSIRVSSRNVTLVISHIGFATQEVKLNNQSTVSVTLETSEKSMDDVVVIGYQTVQRRKTTAAISTVQGKDFENVPYPTFDQMLQGRVAGLNILSISGEPGANNIVNIRGNTSVDATGNGISTPLYVIDGIAMDVSDIRSAYGNANPLQAINPNDIESIDVLKDASAAAIYGARAANGVIIIKTKRPKMGKPQFRASSYIGISTRPAMKKVLVGKEERRMKMDLLNSGGTYVRKGNISQFLTDSLNPAFNNNTDWQGLFLKNSLVKNVDLNLGAAAESFAYRISLNQYMEDGVMRGYSITRSTPRLFLSLKPYKGIEVTTDLFMGITKAKHGPGNQNPYPFSVSNFPSSFWAITDQVKANYEGRNTNVRDDDRTFSVNGNTKLIATIVQNLQFTSSLSYNINNARRDYLMHKSVTTNNRSDAISTSINSRRWEIENYLVYTKEINKKHTVTALLGQGAEQNTNNVTNLRANGIPFDAIQMVQGVPPGPNLSGSTTFEERSRLSFFARAGYDYKGKYGIDGSYRRDASSRYAPSSRWGEFPAVSVRWNVSEEPFFSKISNVVNFLKLRASYGLTGRDPGGYYAQYNQLITDVRWAGSSLGSGSTANVITYNGTTAVIPDYNSAAPAANISWEKTPQMNFGLDASLFRDRISINADYYIKDNKEIVFSIPVPITTGYSQAQNNFVDVRNRGFEFTLNTNNLSNRSKFRWRTTFNIAFNKNFVTKLPAGNRDFVFGPGFLQRTLTIGMPLYQFLGWDVPYVYSTIDDVPVDPLTGNRIRWFGGAMFGAGDGAKRDLNGDYSVDNLDKIYLGDPQTKVYGGLINTFNYKGWSVSVLSTFVTGKKLWNGYFSDKLNTSSGNPYNNWGPQSGPAADFNGLEFWRKPGDVTGLPTLFTVSGVDQWHISQSLFIEDASFFRIKNINIGYMLPDKLTNRFKLKQVRVYSVIDNLKVFYNAAVPDPELVSPNGYTNGNDYPLPKKFTFGLDIQL